MRDQQHIVIRKRGRLGGILLRSTIIGLLWAFVLFVIVVNGCFIFGIYSDSLVSFYLVLNLNSTLYLEVVGAILVVALLMIGYCSWRLRQLRKEAGQS